MLSSCPLFEKVICHRLKYEQKAPVGSFNQRKSLLEGWWVGVGGLPKRAGSYLRLI